MSCLSLISSIFVLCVSFAGCIDSDGCRVRRRSCMWILSSSSDGRLIMHALLHLPQIIPLPLLLLLVEVEGNPSFSLPLLISVVQGTVFFVQGTTTMGD